MKKALLVARWEFRTAVMRRAYVFAVIATPVLFFGLGALSALTTPSPRRMAAANSIAIVDKAGIIDLVFAAEQAARREQLRPGAASPPTTPPVPLVAYEDDKQALADLSAGKVAAVYVIEPDYVSTGNMTAYGRDLTVFGQASANQRQTQVADAIRASLLRKALTPEQLARAYAPAIRVKRLSVDSAGQVEDATDAFGIGNFLGTFGVFILLTMSIFFSAGFLQQATIEDRQNRLFEILLSSLDADELILGKILGLGAAGLLQVGFYIALIIGSSATFLPMIDVSVGKLMLSLPYFIIGYLLFASLMATTGMITRSAQESAQMSAWWTLASMAPVFFLGALTSAPNGLVSRALSFFPLTSPVTMMMRLTILPDLPTIDIVVSIVIGIVSVYVALRATARIFRAATLMYGKRPTLPEFMRWLRAA